METKYMASLETENAALKADLEACKLTAKYLDEGAAKLVSDNAAMREAFNGLGSKAFREGLLATYAGGHHYDGNLEAFQHGMNTVCNVLEKRAEAALAPDSGALLKD